MVFTSMARLAVLTAALGAFAMVACSDNESGEAGDEPESAETASSGNSDSGSSGRNNPNAASRRRTATAQAQAGTAQTPVAATATQASAATPTRGATTAPTQAATIAPASTPTRTGPSGLGPSTPPVDNFKNPGTITKVDAPATAGQAIVEDVRFGKNDGYDRITFEFRGNALPGYEVRYVQAATQCGSGAPVTTAGTAQIVVRLAPAAAHGAAGGSTIDATQLTGAAAIAEAKQSCDFEGVVSWVLGVTGDRPYRVVELSNPPRLAIDVRQ